MKNAALPLLLTLVLLGACSGGADDAADQADGYGQAGEEPSGSPSPTPAASGEITVRRVDLSSGTGSVVEQGSITGPQINDHVLTLENDQYFSVSLSSDNGATYFNVLEPGATDVAMFNGSVGGTSFQATARRSGDYRIRVYLMNDAASTGESARYRLNIEVGAEQGEEASFLRAPPEDVPGDVVFGAGGLEQRCLSEVAGVSGGSRIIGTERVEKTGSGIAVFVRVDSARPLWRCLGLADGTIVDVRHWGG